MHQGTWILVIALSVATCFGVWRAAVDGRFRGTHRVRGAEQAGMAGDPGPAAAVTTGPVSGRRVFADPDLDAELGERATLVQFSSAFCAPCRATRRVLTEVAAAVPGVSYLEVDAEHHLALVRRLGILRTPTTLILDADGRESVRATGAPRKAAVLSALAGILASTRDPNA